MNRPGEEQGHGIHDHVDPDHDLNRKFCAAVYHNEKRDLLLKMLISEW